MGIHPNCRGFASGDHDLHIKLAGYPLSGVSLQWTAAAGPTYSVRRLDSKTWAELGYVVGAGAIGVDGAHAGEGGLISALSGDLMTFDPAKMFAPVTSGTSSATALYPCVDPITKNPVSAGDRILDVTNPDATKTGPWVCAKPEWRRPVDANSAAKLRRGSVFAVEYANEDGNAAVAYCVSGTLGGEMTWAVFFSDLDMPLPGTGGFLEKQQVTGNITATKGRTHSVTAGGVPEVKLPNVEDSEDGDYFEVHGRNATFAITQPTDASTVRIGKSQTAIGGGGRLESRGPYDSICLRYMGGGEWEVVDFKGSFVASLEGGAIIGVQSHLEPVRVTTAQTGVNAMLPGRSYIVDAGGAINMEIFGEGRPGDEIEVVGYAGGYVITQPDNSTECFAGASATSQGNVGTITPAHARNSIRLRCVSYRKWIVTATQGAHTLA